MRVMGIRKNYQH
nr:truncated envelope glycoprotein [Simian-Human immunodeficiency virus]